MNTLNLTLLKSPFLVLDDFLSFDNDFMVYGAVWSYKGLVHSCLGLGGAARGWVGAPIRYTQKTQRAGKYSIVVNLRFTHILLVFLAIFIHPERLLKHPSVDMLYRLPCNKKMLTFIAI